MYINKIENNFTNVINIGRYANFIYTEKGSVYITPEELFDKCQSFNHLVFLGEDPLLQKEDLGKFCRRIVKHNPNIKIDIHTSGLYRPLEINYYRDNVMFYVYIPLSSSGKKWEERVNDTNVKFYIEINANFIFNVKTLEEIDEVSTLSTALGIKKSQVFISSTENINILQYAKLNGYNVYPILEW